MAGQDGPALLVRVADTGIGIQAEHLPKMFQAFRQIDTGISRQHEALAPGWRSRAGWPSASAEAFRWRANSTR
jgi:signal transduction histidine kinase